MRRMKCKVNFGEEGGFSLRKRYDSVLPISFPNGGKIVFDAYSAYEGAEVFFRFENQAYPDNEPSYETEPIRIDTKRVFMK